MAAKEIAQLIENIVSPKKGERLLFITDYAPVDTAQEKKEESQNRLIFYHFISKGARNRIPCPFRLHKTV